MIVNIEFLESKKHNYIHGWAGKQKTSASYTGNIYRLTDNVFKFQIYNLLAVDGSTLDGHYTFYVNKETFQYCLYKHGGYGSLTWFPKVDGNFEDSNKETKLIVEAYCASALLGAYFYDSNAVNSKGKNLFSDGSFEPAGSNFNENIIRYTDGCKCSLICDNRGYLWTDYQPDLKDKKDIEACKLIDSTYKHKKKVSVKYIDRKSQITNGFINYGKNKIAVKQYEYVFNIEVNNIKHVLHYSKSTIGFDEMKLMNLETNDIYGVKITTNINFKKYVKQIGNLYISRYH